jgi:hypothetical protein
MQVGQDGFMPAYMDGLKKNPIAASYAAFGAGASDFLNKFGLLNVDDNTGVTNDYLYKHYPIPALAGIAADTYVGGRAAQGLGWLVTHGSEMAPFAMLPLPDDNHKDW